MRILIIEDEPAYREQILKYCAEAASGMDAVIDYGCNREEAKQKIPKGWDVIYLDLKLDATGMASYDLVRLARQHARIVGVMTGDYSDSSRTQAAESGATTFIPKSHPLEGVRSLVEMNVKYRLDSFPSPTAPSQDLSRTQRMRTLSDAEFAVAEMYVQGLERKEIAKRRSTSDNTVKKQLESVYRKMGVTDKIALVHAWNKESPIRVPDDAA